MFTVIVFAFIPQQRPGAQNHGTPLAASEAYTSRLLTAPCSVN
jgi:hypothetical protein